MSHAVSTSSRRACLLMITIAAGTQAAAGTVSGPSPFAGCTLDTGQPGSVFVQAEVEPWVDVDPGNGDRLIAGWQQDRWSNGGARGNVSAYSTDGGKSWTRVVVPGVSLCSGGPWQRGTDPWISLAPDGTAYFMSLAFMNDLPNGAPGANAMLINRSTDGGQTWSDPVELLVDDDAASFNDKNSLTADPHDSNYVYAIWDRLTELASPSAANSKTVRRRPGHGLVAARERLRQLRRYGEFAVGQAAFTGPTWFARTTDGGASWEPARSIYETGTNAQTIGNQIVVMPSGGVLAFFTHISSDGATTLGFVRSRDRGATFAAPQLKLPMTITNGSRTPDAQAAVRDGNLLFDVAVDPDNGRLYAVWQDGRWSDIDRVAFSMSTNWGSTWSPPVRINRTPASTTLLRNQAITPSVAVGPGGRVYVTYYDYRNDRSDGLESTDYWAISCDPAASNCSKRANWGSEVRLTSTSFDMLKAPVARGHFLGDYQGLARRGTRMVAVFGIATTDNRTSIVSRLFR